MVIKNRLLKLDETLAAIMETYKKSQPYPDDPRIIEYNGVLDKFTELDQDFCQQNPSRTDAEADAELDELENAIKKFIH